ncbi:hypothetical protein [Synechococcus sp. O70.2]
MPTPLGLKIRSRSFPHAIQVGVVWQGIARSPPFFLIPSDPQALDQ